MKKKTPRKYIEKNDGYVDVLTGIKHALKARRRMQHETDLLNDKDFTENLINQDSLTKVTQWLELCGYEITDLYMGGSTDAIDVAGKRFQIRCLKPDVDSFEDLKGEQITVDLVGFWDNTEFFGNILVNSDLTCAVVVLASTQDSWIKVNKWKKRWYSFYKCSVDNVLFYKLDEKSELKWLSDDNSDL